MNDFTMEAAQRWVKQELKKVTPHNAGPRIESERSMLHWARQSAYSAYPFSEWAHDELIRRIQKKFVL